MSTDRDPPPDIDLAMERKPALDAAERMLTIADRASQSITGGDDDGKK